MSKNTRIKSTKAVGVYADIVKANDYTIEQAVANLPKGMRLVDVVYALILRSTMEYDRLRCVFTNTALWEAHDVETKTFRSLRFTALTPLDGDWSLDLDLVGGKFLAFNRERRGTRLYPQMTHGVEQYVKYVVESIGNARKLAGLADTLNAI